MLNNTYKLDKKNKLYDKNKFNHRRLPADKKEVDVQLRNRAKTVP
jgi:hypothetical protein